MFPLLFISYMLIVVHFQLIDILLLILTTAITNPYMLYYYDL